MTILKYKPDFNLLIIQNLFNIRVYGIYKNAGNELLLCDEERFGIKMTKFPGGGLQYGEGTIECLKREAVEEFGQEIKVLSHFYTTDFYQKSYFHENHQLISIYYYFDFIDEIRFKISKVPFSFNTYDEEPISFRFRSLNEINPSELTFPVDQYVLKLLKEKYL
ncbi:MAG: NUDIX domain-containing protein [Bacteroidales bacterium]|nr:NUDIX domain-containing protein [Bacteroidales bacterium]